MSNYTEFVKNYLKEADNKNTEKDEKSISLSVLQKSINNDNQEAFKKEFVNLINNSPSEFGKLFQVFDINGTGTKTQVVLKGSTGKPQLLLPFFNKKLEKNKIPTEVLFELLTTLFQKNGASEDEIKKLGINFESYKTFKEIAGKGIVPEELQKKFQSIENVNNTATFEHRKNEWEKMGECLTYCSVAMLSHFTDKDTKVNEKDFKRAMKAAFSGEKTTEYLDKIKNVDEAMSIDAVLGVLEETYNRGDKKKEELHDSFKIFVKNMLNEVVEKTELPQLELYQQLIQEGNLPELLSYVKFISTDNRYKEMFTKYKNQLETAFNEGKDKIIELESHDTVEKHEDPSGVEKPENRVGRLGHHGPMTFIKNHPNLEKVVNEIDGQKWNIFNCGAKLLIKLMKAFEAGSKALSAFKKEFSDGLKQIKDSLKTMKIEEMEKEVDSIMESDDSPENKSEALLEMMSIAIRKYESMLLDNANNTYSDEWLTYDEAENKYFTNTEFIKALNNDVGLVAKTENLYKKITDALNKLDSGKDVDVKKETAEEQPTENASYEPHFKNSFINEEESVETSMEDEVKKKAETAAKDNATAQNTKENSKKEEPKKEDDKKSTDSKPQEKWQDKKYAFNSIAVEINFGAIGNAAKNFPDIIKTYTEISKKLNGEPADYLAGIASFLEFCNVNKNLKDGRFLNEQEATISTITGKEFMDACGFVFESLHLIKDYTDKMINITEFTIDDDKQNEIRQEIENQFDTSELERTEAVGSALLAIGFNKESDPDKNDGSLVPSANDIGKELTGIKNDLTNPNKDNYRNKLTDIIDRFNKIKEKYNAFRKDLPAVSGQARKNIRKNGGDGYIDNLIVSDLTSTDGIIPTIFVISSYFKHIKEWNSKFEIYEKLPEATEYETELDKAFEAVMVAIPEDIQAEIYDKQLTEWEGAEYKAVLDQIDKLASYVAKNPKIVNEEFLSEIKGIEAWSKNAETAEDFIKNLSSKVVDPVYKLYALAGLNIEDQQQNSNIPDELKKKILEFTSTIAKITDKSEPKKVAEYKKKGEDLYKEIQSALKDNKEMTDYLAEFLKRLQEATKETEGLFVISIVYALNVFASADELKPLMENFTKITNCFLLEGFGNSKLTKAVRGYISSSAKGDDKAKMQAVQTIAKELKANPKIKLEDLKGSNLGAAAFEDLKKDLESVNGSPEKEQANEQDSKAMEELKAKLPEWLKKLIACAEAGKKPVTIKQYAGEYNPIKEDVANYYNKLKEAKKVPEDQVTNDVLLQVLQIAAVVNGGNKEEAKPEQSSSNVPATTEQPKEGGTQESLNWLADEFYKYIRG